MVNVMAVIFFGKSEKNIWVLDFFNYNHRYESVSQSNGRAVHNSRTLGTVQQYNTWNSTTAEQIQQLSQL